MPTIIDHFDPFPDPGLTEDPNAPVAIGGDLNPERLLDAYASGIFPWSINPISWWSPDPRAIFELDGFHTSRSLKRRLKQAPFKVTFDHNFSAVIQQCAKGREEGTWISQEFIDAYINLHELGHAHSVEAWQDDQLVGGLYGVVVGGLFAGESMFHRATDASKIVLHTLHTALREAEFGLFDIQMLTPITSQLGAIEIPRSEYLKRVKTAINLPCQFPSSTTG